MMLEDMLGRAVIGGSIGLIMAVFFLIIVLIVRSKQQKAVPQTSLNTPIAFDMYGNGIYPLGETGFGIAVWFINGGQGSKTRHPYFTVFHQSDTYRQALFSAAMTLDNAYITYPFRERIAEYFRNESSLLESPHLREVSS